MLPKFRDTKKGATMNYHEYIRSWPWRSKRLAAMAAAGNRCERCGADYWLGNKLEAHHLHYRSLGNEQPGDIIVLCAPCHRAAHPEKGGSA